MNKFAKKSLLAGAVALGLAMSTSSAFAALSCKTNISAADKVNALNEIQNLMGRYSHLGHLRGEGTLRELFAMKQKDVFWKTPSGPTGPADMEARFVTPGEAAPGEVGGQLHLHSMLSPVIEVAADGKTAQGVWDSFGPNLSNGTDVGNWLWVKYGVDFIKEDGDWKIWHMQVFAMFNTPYNKSITESAKERAAGGGQGGGMGAGGAPGGAPPGGAAPGGAGGPPGGAAPGGAAAGGMGAGNGTGPAMGGPNQNWTGPAGGQWIYDGKTAPRGPALPEPTCTYDAAKSSAIYGKYENWVAPKK
ncbi:MAG: nuclear transport factor 2 family protein [Steroidobacteraceae bacterium]